MDIKLLPISDLKHAEYNPRKISDEDFEQLKTSLEKFGFVEPLVVNSATGRENVVVGGNQRLEAAKSLGMAEVPVHYVRIDDPAREKELNIRLNRNLGEFDWKLLKQDFDPHDLLKFGFDKDELELKFDIDLDPVREEGSEIPGLPVEPRAKRGDVFTLGRHRLMCGDSTNADDVAQLMAGKKADMVFTDPPYGVSYGAKNEFLNAISRGNCIQTPIENDQKNEEDIQEFWFKAFERIRDVLVDVNSYYITGPQSQGMMMMMMMKAGLPYRHVIIWVKNNHVLGRCDYNYKHEPIFFGWTKTHKFYGNGEFQTSVWEVDKPHKSDLHPTMKPVRLIINALKNSSEQGQLCLDPFLGSGSTLIACEQTSRICYGMEIDPKYCDVIIERYCNYAGKDKEEIYRNAICIQDGTTKT